MTNTSRSIALALLGGVAAPLAGFVAVPVMTNSLGVAGYGEVSAATAPLLFGVVAFTLGLPEAMTFVFARTGRRKGRTLAISCGVTGVIGLVATMVVALVADWLAGGDAELASLIVIGTLALTPALLVGLLRGVAVGYGAWGLISIERTTSAIVRLLLIVTLAFAGNLGVLTATVSIGVSTFAGSVVYIFLWKRSASTGAPTAAVDVRFRGVMAYGGKVWIGAMAGVVLGRFDQLVMTPLSSTRELGLYVVAVVISESVVVVTVAIRDVMFGAESHSPNSSKLAQASRLSTMLTLVAALAIALIGPWAIPFLFGEGFAAAYPVMLVLLLASVAGNPGMIAGSGLSGRGSPELRSYSMIVAALVNVVIVVGLVPLTGAIGAALGTLLGNAIMAWLNIRWMRTRFGLDQSMILLSRADIRVVRDSVRRLGPGSSR